MSAGLPDICATMAGKFDTPRLIARPASPHPISSPTMQRTRACSTGASSEFSSTTARPSSRYESNTFQRIDSRAITSSEESLSSFSPAGLNTVRANLCAVSYAERSLSEYSGSSSVTGIAIIRAPPHVAVTSRQRRTERSENYWSGARRSEASCRVIRCGSDPHRVSSRASLRALGKSHIALDQEWPSMTLPLRVACVRREKRSETKTAAKGAAVPSCNSRRSSLRRFDRDLPLLELGLFGLRKGDGENPLREGRRDLVHIDALGQ